MARLYLLLVGACFLVLRVQAESKWSIAVGGSESSTAGLMALDGTDRFIAAKLGGVNGGGASSNTDLYNEFLWSDGTYKTGLASNAFMAAKVHGVDNLHMVKQPRYCYPDEGGVRKCEARDHPFWQEPWDTQNLKALAVGSGNDKPVGLFTVAGSTTRYRLQQLWKNWGIEIEAVKGRVRVDKRRVNLVTDATNDWTAYDWNSYTSHNPVLTLKKVSSTNDRMYMLFSFRGDVRIGNFDGYGKILNTHIVKADVYVDVCTVADRYDMADGLVLTDGQTMGPSAVGKFVDTYCHRDSYLLVAVDIAKGNLLYVQPILAQVAGPSWQNSAGPAFNFDKMVASKYDQAVYFYGALEHRVWFGEQETFETRSILSKFVKKSTLAPLLDAVKTNSAGPSTTRACTIPADSAYNGGVLVYNTNDFETSKTPTPYVDGKVCYTESKSSVVPKKRTVFRLEAAGDGSVAASILRLRPTWRLYDLAANPLPYSQTLGGVTAEAASVDTTTMATDDASARVFITGTYSAGSGTTTVARPLVALDQPIPSYDIDVLYWGSTENKGATVLDVYTVKGSGKTSTDYDPSDLFVVGLDGKDLAKGSSWSAILNGAGDAPTVSHIAASAGNVWVVGKHRNSTIVNVADPRATKEGWIVPRDDINSYFLAKLNAEDGKFADAATMYGSGIVIQTVAAGGPFCFLYAAFSGVVAFDNYIPERNDQQTIYPRASASLMIAGFGEGQPASWDYNRGWRLGWGIGIGLGIPLLIVLVLLVLLVLKKKKQSTQVEQAQGKPAKVAPEV